VYSITVREIITTVHKPLVALTIILLIFAFTFPVAIAQNTETPNEQGLASALQSAKTAVEQAFNELHTVEAAGVNITQLTNQLNEAANLLAHAQNAYTAGDVTTAQTSASQAASIATAVYAAAQNETQLASKSNQTVEVETIIASAVGIVVFVLGLFLVWRRFKGNYLHNLSDSTPEVSSGEA
jgi:type II secretory pathway pseudopilin PulG